jgi:hypothetical protein
VIRLSIHAAISNLSLIGGVIVVEVFVALFVAFLVGGLFGLAMRRRMRRTGFFWFFLILFLATWAGGIWIGPLGPSLRGVYWLPFVLVAVVVGFLLAAVAPRRAPRDRIETLEMLEEIEQERKLEKLTYISLGLFFWMALFVLITAIVVRYAL